MVSEDLPNLVIRKVIVPQGVAVLRRAVQKDRGLEVNPCAGEVIIREMDKIVEVVPYRRPKGDKEDSKSPKNVVEDWQERNAQRAGTAHTRLSAAHTLPNAFAKASKYPYRFRSS